MKARSENLSEHISTLTLTNDTELSPSQRVDKFFKYVDVSVLFSSLPANVYCWLQSDQFTAYTC